MKTVFSFLLASLLSLSGFTQINMSLKSKYAFPQGIQLANLWGYTDGQGREYALVGTSVGMSIIEVTDPANPVLRAEVPGPQSIWREVRTYQHYAYVTTEGGGGLQIVDLSGLPNSVTQKIWKGNNSINNLLNTIHALQVDNNHIYLYGSNLFNGAAVIANLSDPWNPNYVGNTGNVYIHDGYVRNDTMYAGHIYAGYVSIFNLVNKTNPQLIQTQITPSAFPHNTWLSDNGRVMFTTDEKNNSYLTSYDISALPEIKELSRIQSNPGTNSMVHNTHVLNDYAVTSWYRDGVIIVDGHRPQNLVIVGSYDTSPLSGGGSNGCWGVYPYLPSGNIIASDMEEGLYVLGANYVRAAYLEGTVTDSLCGTPISKATVIISTVGSTTKTNIEGLYKTGTHMSGVYNVNITAPGYQSKTISGIILNSGFVTNLNVNLHSTSTVAITGRTERATDGVGLGGTFISLRNNNNSYNLQSDNSGNFSTCNVLGGTYEVTAGKWGYVSKCEEITIDLNSPFLNIELERGFYDDFTFNFGWNVTGNATSGNWVRAKPIGTFIDASLANPSSDVQGDCGEMAFVTGNGSGHVLLDDVDNGETVLSSPFFDLSAFDDPYINYYRWFFNGPSDYEPNDTLKITLSNGITSVVLENVTIDNEESEWTLKSFRVKDYITPTGFMAISFKAADYAPDHIMEAGVDRFQITDGFGLSIAKNSLGNELNIYPNPFTDKVDINYVLSNLTADSKIVVTDVLGRNISQRELKSPEGMVSMEISGSPGIYFLSIVKGGSIVKTSKVIKRN
jgi:choice-of-anchor B domain-containing protein